MAVPVALGMAVRARSEKYASLMEKIVKSVAVLLLVVLIVGAAGRQASRLGELAQEVGLPVVVLNIGTMLLGFTLTRLLALPGRQTIAIVMEVGIQNSALAVGLTMSFFGGEYAVPAIVYSLFVYLTGFLIVLIGRSRYPALKSEMA